MRATARSRVKDTNLARTITTGSYSSHSNMMLRPAALSAILATASLSLHGADVASMVREKLDGLRGMTLPKEKVKIAEANQRMDAAWSYVRAHREVAIPIVQAELTSAVAAEPADQFFLLDLGFLLLTEGGDKYAPISLQAFGRIDSAAEIIQANWEEVFHCAMKLGATGVDPARYLDALDRIFWPSQRAIDFFRAPHLVKLSPDDVCCLVYGVAGDAAAGRLAARLKADKSARPRRLQLLTTVGSESHTPTATAILAEATDYETVSAAVTFLMTVGGPSGRAAVLSVDPAMKDSRTTDYLRRLR